jgi:hypothetical protein
MTLTVVRRPNGKYQVGPTGKLVLAPCPCSCEEQPQLCEDSSMWANVSVGTFNLTQGVTDNYCNGNCGTGTPVGPGAETIWYGKDTNDVQHWVWSYVDANACPGSPNNRVYAYNWCDCTTGQNSYTQDCCDVLWDGTKYILRNFPYNAIILP